MIKIKVSNSTEYFIKKNLKNNIEMYDIKKEDNTLYLNIRNSDLEKVKKLNYYSKIEVVKHYGFRAFLKKLKKYYYDLMMVTLFFIILYFFSNVIVDVEIKHENKKIKEYVMEILNNKQIKKYTIKKDLKELNQISDDVMFEHKDIIDWISINNIGMKYIISIEERVNVNNKKKEDACHIVAKRDGVITNIKYDKGVSLVEAGTLVKKGDILISGEIILNEDIKDNVCASGEVFGETWYRVNVILPLDYVEEKKTGKSRINFIMNGNYFYKKNYEHYDEEILYKIANFKIVKQKEIEILYKKYSEEEARKKAIEEAKKKLLSKIGKNNKIISEKVLKEKQNDSKIELEIFISVNESIGEQTIYKVSDKDDTE